MQTEAAKQDDGSAAVAAPFLPATGSCAAFKRGQRVVVLYGVVQVYSVVGHYGKAGRVTSRKDWRRGWYEVEIDWDVTTSTPVLVTAHQSALAVN